MTGGMLRFFFGCQDHLDGSRLAVTEMTFFFTSLTHIDTSLLPV